MGSVTQDHTGALHTLIAERLQHTGAPGNETPAEWTTTHDPRSTPIPDDKKLIKKALMSMSIRTAFTGGATFRQLWEADGDVLAKVYPPQNETDRFDRSAADLALCSHLAWWTGGDCVRIDRLYRESGLYAL